MWVHDLTFLCHFVCSVVADDCTLVCCFYAASISLEWMQHILFEAPTINVLKNFLVALHASEKTILFSSYGHECLLLWCGSQHHLTKTVLHVWVDITVVSFSWPADASASFCCLRPVTTVWRNCPSNRVTCFLRRCCNFLYHHFCKRCTSHTKDLNASDGLQFAAEGAEFCLHCLSFSYNTSRSHQLRSVHSSLSVLWTTATWTLHLAFHYLLNRLHKPQLCVQQTKLEDMLTWL